MQNRLASGKRQTLATTPSSAGVFDVSRSLESTNLALQSLLPLK